MVSFPPCKINLGLHVVSKRTDGYHDIETIFYPVPWTDILEIIPSDKLSFQSSGNVIPGRAQDNLCLKAYQVIRKDFNVNPVTIHLHKIIPTGAGLGGGSSDAAYTLRLLNDLFDLKVSVDQLKQYAAQIGSDCAFFVQDGPMLEIGRGEILEPITVDLKGKFLVIVKPEVHVSTAMAYSGVSPQVPDRSLKDIVSMPLREWKPVLKNDFEKTVFPAFPQIHHFKEKMYEAGAIYASMSGSGSSVFALFDKPVETDSLTDGLIHWSGILS